MSDKKRVTIYLSLAIVWVSPWMRGRLSPSLFIFGEDSIYCDGDDSIDAPLIRDVQVVGGRWERLGGGVVGRNM